MNAYSQPSLALLLAGIVLFAARTPSNGAPLTAAAWNITATPGAAALAAKHPMKENDSPMRFEVLALLRADEWKKLDLKTGSLPLRVEAVESGVSVALPNAGKCVITTSPKDAYAITFSSPEAGVSKTVPTGAGDRLLLGSPQNNANDAQFILIEIKPASR